jgi:hypothetical protein
MFDIPLPAGDEWSDGHMRLPKTKPDEVHDSYDNICPGYKNLNTGWWDGSQIYGSSETVTTKLRGGHPDGKLVLSQEAGGFFLPRDEHGNIETGFTTNWWVGLELLHTLFALEHNALCDMFRKVHPDWTG